MFWCCCTDFCTWELFTLTMSICPAAEDVKEDAEGLGSKIKEKAKDAAGTVKEKAKDVKKAVTE